MKTQVYRIPRTASFCSYRSYRFNELVIAHFYRENGVYPPFAILRDYFKRATALAIRAEYRGHVPSSYICV